MPTYFNDLEFKAEDALLSLFTAPVLALLGGAPVVLSLVSDSLTNSHVAIIADDFEAFPRPRLGEYTGNVRIKVVTNFDEENNLPAGFANLRALHRQRCGVVRDTIAESTLDTDLSAAVADFTVVGFHFGRISQRIVGRSWVTEWSVVLESVCALDG